MINRRENTSTYRKIPENENCILAFPEKMFSHEDVRQS
jgi:hypothetical protein